MNFNERPELRDHDSFLSTISTLNKYDKVNGYRIEGTNRFQWYKYENGAFQGVLRAGNNAIENTKQVISTNLKSLQNSFYAKLQNSFSSYITSPQNHACLESSSLESSPIDLKEDTLPDFLGDAKVVSRGIKKEAKEISRKIDDCSGFIENCTDISELETLKNDLKFVKAGMSANLTGLSNLSETYKYETTSHKQIIKNNPGKYEVAVKNFEKVKKRTTQDLIKIDPLLNQIEEKIQRLGKENPGMLALYKSAYSMGLNTPADLDLEAPISPFAQDNLLPDDFPKNTDESPRNMHVAISEFLSNPFHIKQPDNRQIHCDTDGELSLQGENESGQDDVQNFMQMIAESYGAETRNLLVSVLSTRNWEFLTIGRVKSALSMLAVIANPTLASRFNGEENCLALIPTEERAKVLHNPEEHFIQIQFSMTHLVNGQGLVVKIEELFPSEYREALKISRTPKAVQAREKFENKLTTKKPKPKPKPQLGSSFFSDNIIVLAEKKSEPEDYTYLNGPSITLVPSGKGLNEPLSTPINTNATKKTVETSNIVFEEVKNTSPIDVNVDSPIHTPITLKNVSVLNKKLSLPTPENLPELERYHHPYFLSKQEMLEDKNFILAAKKALEGEWDNTRAINIKAKSNFKEDVQSKYDRLLAAWEVLKPILDDSKNTEVEASKNGIAESLIFEPAKSTPPPPPPAPPMLGSPPPPPPPPGEKKDAAKLPTLNLPKAKTLNLDFNSNKMKKIEALGEYLASQEELVALLFPFHKKLNIIFPGLEEELGTDNAITSEQLSKVMETFNEEVDLGIQKLATQKVKKAPKELVEYELDPYEKMYIKQIELKKRSLIKTNGAFTDSENEYKALVECVNKNGAELEEILGRNYTFKEINAAKEKYDAAQKNFDLNAHVLKEKIEALQKKKIQESEDLKSLIGSQKTVPSAILSEASTIVTRLKNNKWDGEIPQEIKDLVEKQKAETESKASKGQFKAINKNTNVDANDASFPEFKLKAQRSIRKRYVPIKELNLIRSDFYLGIIRGLREKVKAGDQDVISQWNKTIGSINGTSLTLQMAADACGKHYTGGKAPQEELLKMFEAPHESVYESYAKKVFEKEFLINTAISLDPQNDSKFLATAYEKLYYAKEPLTEEEQLSAKAFESQYGTDATEYAEQRLNKKTPDAPWIEKE